MRGRWPVPECVVAAPVEPLEVRVARGDRPHVLGPNVVLHSQDGTTLKKSAGLDHPLSPREPRPTAWLLMQEVVTPAQDTRRQVVLVAPVVVVPAIVVAVVVLLVVVVGPRRRGQRCGAAHFVTCRA